MMVSSIHSRSGLPNHLRTHHSNPTFILTTQLLRWNPPPFPKRKTIAL